QKSMIRILPSCFFKTSPTESFLPVCEVIFCAKDVLENSVLLICGTFCPNTDNAKNTESTVKSCFITPKSFQQELSKIRYQTKSGRFLLCWFCLNKRRVLSFHPQKYPLLKRFLSQN